MRAEHLYDRGVYTVCGSPYRVLIYGTHAVAQLLYRRGWAGCKCLAAPECGGRGIRHLHATQISLPKEETRCMWVLGQIALQRYTRMPVGEARPAPTLQALLARHPRTPDQATVPTGRTCSAWPTARVTPTDQEPDFPRETLVRYHLFGVAVPLQTSAFRCDSVPSFFVSRPRSDP